MNPFKYRPAQIAKALIAALTGVVGILGLIAASFTDGALANVGTWATAVALILTPILVFLKKAEPWIGMLDGLRGTDPSLPFVQYRDDDSQVEE